MQLVTQTHRVIETSRACSRFSWPSAFVDGSISPTLRCKFAEKRGCKFAEKRGCNFAEKRGCYLAEKRTCYFVKKRWLASPPLSK